MTTPIIYKVTQADIDKLLEKIGNDPALVSIVNYLFDGYQPEEQALGIDFQRDATPVVPPVTPDAPPVTPPVTPQPAQGQIVDPRAGNARVGYRGTGTSEVSMSIDDHTNVHPLVNDRDENGRKLTGGTWAPAGDISGHACIVDNVLTVDNNTDSQGAHLVYLGLQEPTGDSPFLQGNPVSLPTTGHGDKLRMFFKSVAK
jgi:hypothetical protein